jgi:hypothetical protein
MTSRSCTSARQRIADRTTREDDDMAWARPLIDEARAAIARGDACSLEEAERDIDRAVAILGRRSPRPSSHRRRKAP